ncbi:hypothetical protein C1H46_000571 [Malus baccata]|uniref:Uncharacterized protein n=1 Tax=Malus baccata TaxID=106549 RepID=A0A540NTP7_MALBA|nr:hypothetical protein C1H46_000571 [Malus baccata]
MLDLLPSGRKFKPRKAWFSGNRQSCRNLGFPAVKEGCGETLENIKKGELIMKACIKIQLFNPKDLKIEG